MFTNSSMTIYNKHTVPATKNVIYKGTAIDNVFWDSIESVSERNGANKQDEVVVYIPFDKNDISNYVQPKQYDGSANKWTLKEGDIIVKGNLISTIPNIDKISDLKNYEAFTIYFVDEKDFGNYNMQHFKVKGK